MNRGRGGLPCVFSWLQISQILPRPHAGEPTEARLARKIGGTTHCRRRFPSNSVALWVELGAVPLKDPCHGGRLSFKSGPRRLRNSGLTRFFSTTASRNFFFRVSYGFRQHSFSATIAEPRFKMASYEPKQPAVATSTEWKQSWSAPKAAPGSEEPWTTETPIWHVVVRGFQIFFGLVIAGMAGYLIHGYLMDAVAFGLVCVSRVSLEGFDVTD